MEQNNNNAGDANSKAKAWMFTIQNPLSDELSGTFADSQVLFAAWQLERAPSTGTLHLQGYCVMKKVQSFAQMRRLLPGAHLEVRRGTHAQAIAYCSKADTRVEGHQPRTFGQDPGDTADGQGARTDLARYWWRRPTIHDYNRYGWQTGIWEYVIQPRYSVTEIMDFI